MVTPLITKIKSEGGTLYTFTSASKDLTRCYTNGTNYQMKFSKFVCLNLPWIKNGNFSLNKFDVDDRIFTYVTAERVNDGSYDHLVVEFKVTENVYNSVTECDVEFCNFEEKYTFQEKTDRVYSHTFEHELKQGENIKFIITVHFDDREDFTTGELLYETGLVGNGVEKGLYLENFPAYKLPTKSDIDKRPTGKNEMDDEYNYAIAQHFQNYILNFETVVMNSSDFDNSILRSPAERIFFNWLKKVGGIRFDDINSETATESYNKLIDRTVQYVGKIDMINQVDINGDTFGEVYMYIPSTSGATSQIFFRKLTDNNYRKDEKYEPVPMGSDVDTHTIQGRSNFENNPDLPIDINAIYDSLGSSNYYTSDDGYCIDFRNSTYKDIAGVGEGIDAIEQLNGNSYANFEFNTILIYYDLYDTSTDEIKYAPNLYGVLFIDNFQQDNENISGTDNRLAHVHQYPKYKSSDFGDGNAFALKLDLKIDTAPTTTMSASLNNTEIYDNPNDVAGMVLFSESLIQLQRCIDTFFTQQHEIYNLQDRVEDLETIVTNIDDINEVRMKLSMLEDKFAAAGVLPSASVVEKLTYLTNTLHLMTTGKYNPRLSLDTGMLYEGYGIGIERRNDAYGSVVINNTQQAYNVVGSLTFNENSKDENLIKPYDDVIRFELLNGTNLVVLEETESKSSDRTEWNDLVISIEAFRDIKWKKGQNMRFMIGDNFKFGNVRHKSLILETVFSPIVNDDYNSVVHVIKQFTKDDLAKIKNNIEIEIICVDDDFTNPDGKKFITIVR